MLFFPNLPSYKFGFGSAHWVLILPLPGIVITFLYHLCPENLVWLPECLGHTVCWFLLLRAAQLSGWGPPNRARQQCGCTPFVVRILPTISSSKELSFFLWAILGNSLDPGLILPFVPSLGMPLELMGSFNTVRNIYYLYQLKPEKIFERI